MLRLAADGNFNNGYRPWPRALETGSRHVRVQDAGLSGADDAVVLDWAANERRVLVTHDAATITKHAYDRVRAARPMPGVFEVSPGSPLGPAIDDLLLIVECSLDGEWEGQIRYLPL